MVFLQLQPQIGQLAKMQIDNAKSQENHCIWPIGHDSSPSWLRGHGVLFSRKDRIWSTQLHCICLYVLPLHLFSLASFFTLRTKVMRAPQVESFTSLCFRNVMLSNLVFRLLGTSAPDVLDICLVSCKHLNLKEISAVGGSWRRSLELKPCRSSQLLAGMILLWRMIWRKVHHWRT